MSVAAEAPNNGGLPPSWHRLERAIQEACAALPEWHRRAIEAEDEVARLRHTLETLATERDLPADVDDELARLRAENAALRSRMAEARKRVHMLLTRVNSLEIEG